MSAGMNQVDNWLRKRIRNLKFLAFLYLLLTFMLPGAAVWIYGGTADRAAEDAEKLTPTEAPRLIDFNDAATNPDDGTVVVVGDESSIQIISDKLKIKKGRIKHDDDQVEKKRSDLHSVAFSGYGRTAIAAGDDGLILVSGDRGKSWKSVRSNTGKDFTEIALSKTGNIAVAVGDRGLIRVSHNSGHTWFKPENITSNDINGVALSDDGETVVVVADNDKVLVSKDKGKNWECKTGDFCNSVKSKRDLEAVAFYGKGDTAAAIAVGDKGALWISCTGGRKWRQSNSDSSKERFNAVAFSGDGKTAIAVGRRGVVWVSNGLCTNTTNDGVFVDSKAGDNLEAVDLNEDGRIAVAAGRDGTVLVSNDGGKNWSGIDTETTQRFHSVTLSNDGKSGIVVGKESTVLRLSSPRSFSTPTNLLDTVDIMEEAVLQSDDRRKVKSDNNLETIASIFTLTDRIGTFVILLIMVHYLMSLARYNLRLAAFYQARRDTIQLNEMEELPRPENVDELGRMMEALSPDGLDFGRSPKTAADMAMQLARTIGYDRKSSVRRE